MINWFRTSRVLAVLSVLASAGGDGVRVAQAEEDLGGTYVLFQQTTTVTRLPVLSDVEARTRSVSLHRLEHEEARLFGSGKLCDLRIISSNKMIRTKLPPAFKRLVADVPFDAALHREAHVLGIVQNSPTLILGARLEHPERDSLPSHAKDARVFDQDGDGHPGVTVEVEGFVSGEVYVVQRSRSRLSGERRGTSFRGLVGFSNEQKVVGASSALLERDPKAEPVPSASYFVLQKVAPGLDCSAATRLAATLPN